MNYGIKLLKNFNHFDLNIYTIDIRIYYEKNFQIFIKHRCIFTKFKFFKTQIKGLYFNCGWGTGGFKATPGSGDLFAHTIANDEPHKLNAAFNLNRFVSGDLVDEHGAAAVAH